MIDEGALALTLVRVDLLIKACKRRLRLVDLSEMLSHVGLPGKVFVAWLSWVEGAFEVLKAEVVRLEMADQELFARVGLLVTIVQPAFLLAFFSMIVSMT